MTSPKAHTSHFDYVLPEERIALHPLPQRTAAKLLAPNGQEILDRHIRDLPTLLTEPTAIFINNTKVVHARLLFPLGERTVEIFCLGAADGRSIDHILHQRGEAEILAMVGGAKRWKQGALTIDWQVGHETIGLSAWKGEAAEGRFKVRLQWTGSYSLAEVLQEAGHVPLPPYIHREDELEDDERYQTVYAEHQGSVAAPTAGLHFDEHLLQQLTAEGHSLHPLVLHVGAGTFKPISGDAAHEHIMHGEEIVVDLLTLQQLAELPHKVMAIGTTSMRTLESLYWLGVKAHSGENPGLGLSQHDAYQLPQELSLKESLTALVHYLVQTQLTQLRCSTHLYIMPGYRFRVVDKLLTNFHQPKSTLLLLVAAFYGDHWKALYTHALNNGYRFLSYGDAMLLQRAEV